MATTEQLIHLRSRVIESPDDNPALWNTAVQILIHDSAGRAAFLALDPTPSEGAALRLVQAVMPGAETVIVYRFDRCSARVSTYKRRLLTGDAHRPDGVLWRAVLLALVQVSIVYNAV